ncbi:DMT family transporter [uncultured Metabacillus sp.]|uniref:DMT family transporter n=1 Tax=uncultured Metabacillus sp. TaxID=2860135 RepID=UPI00260B1D25|nr:DMT family transporter [uncultured Metabacillus sp.]
MNKNIFGSLLVLFSASCFGVMGILAKYAYAANISIGTLLFFRFFLAAVLFWALIFYKKIPCRLQVKQIPILFIMGTGGYAMMAILLFTSFSLLPVSLASSVYYLYLVFVVILNSLFSRKLFKKFQIAAILLSIIGLYLMLGADFSQINIIGLICGFGCAIIYSGYIILTEKIQSHINHFLSAAYVTSFAAITLFIFSMFRQDFSLDFHYSGWFPILGIALFSTFFSILAFSMGIERIGSSKAALLSIFEPIVTVLLSYFLFQENIGLIQKMGIILILLSALLTNVRWRKKTLSKKVEKSILYKVTTRSNTYK